MSLWDFVEYFSRHWSKLVSTWKHKRVARVIFIAMAERYWCWLTVDLLVECKYTFQTIRWSHNSTANVSCTICAPNNFVDDIKTHLNFFSDWDIHMNLFDVFRLEIVVKFSPRFNRIWYFHIEWEKERERAAFVRRNKIISLSFACLLSAYRFDSTIYSAHAICNASLSPFSSNK